MSYKEFFHDEIEHESSNEKQGKTRKQNEDIARLYIAGVIVLILMVITLFIVGVVNDFKP